MLGWNISLGAAIPMSVQLIYLRPFPPAYKMKWTSSIDTGPMMQSGRVADLHVTLPTCLDLQDEMDILC